MNRFQRNYYRNCPFPPNKTPVQENTLPIVDEFLTNGTPTQARSFEKPANKIMYNRSCYISPELKDFAQSMDFPTVENPMNLQVEKSLDRTLLQTPLQEKTEIKETATTPAKEERVIKESNLAKDDFLPVTIATLRELRKLLGFDVSKVENYSSTDDSTRDSFILKPRDKPKWSTRENEMNITDDITKEKENNISKQDEQSLSLRTSEIYISDVPTVHVIAEKFTKYKKDNIELRRLDEKIVCVEYDIYDGITEKPIEPVQKMRAFFSIKPQIQKASNDGGKENLCMIPSEVKNDFNISNSDLKKLNDREIEILDAKISEHNTYLDDLRSILKRRNILDSKKKKRFDLKTMYEMARRNKLLMDEEDITGSNIFSKSELEEIKDLVLKKTNSNISGITRRTIPKRNGVVTIMEDNEDSVKSQSFVKELFALD